MKRNFSLFLLALILLSLAMPAGATIIYVSGDQTGTWAADTVVVTAEVRVPPGETLTIQPGVEVLFSVYCKLIVDSTATLRAVGKAADSIRFDALLADSSWHGIRFLSASDSSRLEYCILTHGYASGSGEDVNGGAIYSSNSSPVISHNTISGNSAGTPYIYGGAGGGIYCSGGSPIISDNTINGNSAPSSNYFPIYLYGCGGGIYCTNSNPTISGNTISGNSASASGSGIWCNSGSTITGNTISNNTSYWCGAISCGSGNTIIDNTISENSGGGISCGSGSTIIDNTISENSGAGVKCQYSGPIISGNTITENSYAGIYCDESSPTIGGNTISENSPCGIYFWHSSPTLFNCILWGNSPQQIIQDVGSNLQATYCDIQDTLWPGVGNISVDPCFVDTASGEYHLQSTVGSFHGGQWLPDPLHSPCIDAGDPSSPFDLEPLPNGGRINMGFEGNTVEASLSTNTWASPPIAELPREFRLDVPHPNPFNLSTVLGYQLPVASHVNLWIYDTAGRLVAELVSGWRDAGAHEITFNGSDLPSGISFAKLEAGDYIQVQKLVLMK